jgi:ABC-type transport system involved in Fe-S cluster assembly fused permease/ATPase subunit
MDKVLKTVLKRQIPFIIGGTITGIIVTYYYGFLFSIIVNSAIWMLISFIVNKYYWKSTGFKDERYLMHYAVSKLHSRSRSIA